MKTSARVCSWSTPDWISTLLSAPLTCRKTPKDTCALYPRLYLPTHLCRAHLARLSRKWIHCLLILAALEYDFVRLINISEIPKPCVCVWLPVPSRPDASTDSRPNPLPLRTPLPIAPSTFTARDIREQLLSRATDYPKPPIVSLRPRDILPPLTPRS